MCSAASLCVRGCSELGCQSLLQAQQLSWGAAVWDPALLRELHTPQTHSSQGKHSAWEENLGWSPGDGLILDTDFSTARALHWHWQQPQCSACSPHCLPHPSPGFSWHSSNSEAGWLFQPSVMQPLLYLQGSTMLMQHRCLEHSPFQGLQYSPSLLSYPSAVAALPFLGSHGCAGGYPVHPHHMPYTRGFQEPAGILLQDPSSLICFNSPLKTWVSKEAEIFFLYLFRTCCHHSIFMLLWCKQKAPYMWAVQDVSCTLKQTNSKNHHTSNNIQLYSLGSHKSPTPIYYCTWGVYRVKIFGFQKRLLMRQTPIKNIKQVFMILKQILWCKSRKVTCLLASEISSFTVEVTDHVLFLVLQESFWELNR